MILFFCRMSLRIGSYERPSLIRLKSFPAFGGEISHGFEPMNSQTESDKDIEAQYCSKKCVFIIIYSRIHI